MILINVLIILCIFLIIYQFFVSNNDNTLIEGVENNNSTYKAYDTNNPKNALILAQQNAGNISALHQKVDKLDGTEDTIDNMKQNMSTMQAQINSLTKQQSDYAKSSLGGGAPPPATEKPPDN